MINFRAEKDVLNGNLFIYNDSEDLTGSIVSGRIEIKELGTVNELNSTSTPTLTQFIAPSSSYKITIDAKVDKVVTVEYDLFVDIGAFTYTVNDNKVNQLGIYNLFSNANYIYLDKRYTIDKGASTSNQLVLTEPIDVAGITTAYKDYYISRCITLLYDILQQIKYMTLSYDGLCVDCENIPKKITDCNRLVEGLDIQEEAGDCEKQNNYVKALKHILNIC